MNPLDRSLIEKAGYANGWENVRESTAERVIVFSAGLYCLTREKHQTILASAATHGALRDKLPTSDCPGHHRKLDPEVVNEIPKPPA